MIIPAPATTCSRPLTRPGRLGMSCGRTTRSAPGSTPSRIFCRMIPYEELPRDKPQLPKRQKPHGYAEPNYPYKYVPELGWPVE